jgi:hypothetical protein
MSSFYWCVKMTDNFRLARDLLCTSIYLQRVAGKQKYSESIIKHAWFEKTTATYCSNRSYGTVTTRFFRNISHHSFR